jgi:hypothetical protein
LDSLRDIGRCVYLPDKIDGMSFALNLPLGKRVPFGPGSAIDRCWGGGAGPGGR